MKTISCVSTPILAVATLLAALPAHASISIDRESPSIGMCPARAAHIYRRVMPPTGGCDVAGPGPVVEVPDLNFGLGPADDLDALATNEALAPTTLYFYHFSGDTGSIGLPGTNYNVEASAGQAAGDVWRTVNLPTDSPWNVMAGACAAPANVAGIPVGIRNQRDFNLVETINPGMAATFITDDLDALEIDPIDTTGDLVHDRDLYFSVDPASPFVGLGSPADLLFVPAGGAAPVLYAGAGALGLGRPDDVDALVVWDQAPIGIANSGDLVLFSLAPGSFALRGADGILGTADDFSAADLLVSDLSGVFCLYLRHNQLGLRFQDDLDALDVTN